MLKFIQDMLHVKVTLSAYEDMGNLPLAIRGLYEISMAAVEGVTFLLVRPKEKVSLTAMRKNRLLIKKQAGLECVLQLPEATAYVKAKLLEEGVPFILEGKEIYMPFLGVALSNKKERIIPPVERLSFTTQKLLLTAIYKKWREVSSSEVAHQLGVANMTITRCFDELDGLELPLVQRSGSKRLFVHNESTQDLWALVRPALRSPISKTYRLENEIDTNGFQLAGISALSFYSQLADNAYQTYALQKKQKGMLPDAIEQVPKGEVPAAMLLLTHYRMDHIDLFPKHVMDPLSAVLCLSDAELSDPRVEASIEEMMEEYVW